MKEVLAYILACVVPFLLFYISTLKRKNRSLEDENLEYRQRVWREELRKIQKRYVDKTDIDTAVSESNEYFKSLAARKKDDDR